MILRQVKTGEYKHKWKHEEKEKTFTLMLMLISIVKARLKSQGHPGKVVVYHIRKKVTKIPIIFADKYTQN